MKKLMIGATALGITGALLVAGVNLQLTSERVTERNVIETIADVVSGRVPSVCVARVNRLMLVSNWDLSRAERASFRQATEEACTEDIAITLGALRPT